jgi:DNA-directed RNA polymerase I subunit RPA2
MPFIYSIIIFLILLYVMKSFFRYSYDMEDAMILNKSAVDRGMFRGHIYQASYVSLFVTTHCLIYNLMQSVLERILCLFFQTLEGWDI